MHRGNINKKNRHQVINGSSVRKENDLAEERQREMVKKKKKKNDIQEYEGAHNQSQESAIFEFQR